jgi:hypothetical protein
MGKPKGPLRRASRVFVSRGFPLIVLLTVASPLAVGQRTQQTDPKVVVTRYIKAVQNRDYKTIIDLTASYQGEVAVIKASNPQVLWSKLIDEYYQQVTKLLSNRTGELRSTAALLPESCKWIVIEIRGGRVGPVFDSHEATIVYVSVNYPLWREAPLIGTKLLKSAIVQFSLDRQAQLVLGVSRVTAGDVFAEEPMRILRVTVQMGFEGIDVGYAMVGGTAPINCSAQFGTAQRQQDCSRGARFSWEELGIPEGSGFGWRTREREFKVHLRAVDAKGRTDEAYLSVPVFRSQIFPLWSYCWVAEPWFGKGLGRPPGPTICKEPINRLTEGAAPAPPAPSKPGQPAAVPTPGAPPTASCGDYDACLRAGMSAFRYANWPAAISNFQAAAGLRPTSAVPWAGLSGGYLRTGQMQNLIQAWEKTLSLGGKILIPVCHELAFRPCDRGILWVSANSVAFRDIENRTIFSVPPSQVIAKGVSNNSTMAYASFGLRVGGRNYDFDFVPFRAGCRTQLFVQCPPQGVAQQLAVANYVEQTIPKLASGAFAQSRSSEEPTSSAPGPGGTSPNGALTPLGYFGTWKKVNPGGYPTLIISGTPANTKVHAWGACRPQDCDEGVHEAHWQGHALVSVFKQQSPSTTGQLIPYVITFRLTLRGSNGLTLLPHLRNLSTREETGGELMFYRRIP